MVWLGLGPDQTIIATPSTASLILTLNAAADALRPFTVMRTRFEISMDTDQNVASEGYGAAYGLCVVSDQASAIGVSAVPTPITDIGSDLWFVYGAINGDLLLNTAVGFTGGSSTRIRENVDSKAMRRVN